MTKTHTKNRTPVTPPLPKLTKSAKLAKMTKLTKSRKNSGSHLHTPIYETLTMCFVILQDLEEEKRE